MQLSDLHKILPNIMSPQDVQTIMLRIFLCILDDVNREASVYGIPIWINFIIYKYIKGPFRYIGIKNIESE